MSKEKKEKKVKPKKSFSMSFKNAYLLVGVGPLAIGMLIMAITLISLMKSKIENGIVDELRVAAEQVNEYFAYDIVANGAVDYDEYSDHEYIESLKDNSIELTLFKGDTRFLTSLKNADGTYNEGTQANADIYALVSKGESYTSSDVKIGNQDYFVFYYPIYDGDGNFWGMAFAGEPTSKVTATVNAATLNVVVLTIGLVVVFSIIIFILGNSLAKSMVTMEGAIKTLSTGELNADFSGSSVIREINELIIAGSQLQTQLIDSVGGAKETAVDLSQAVTRVDGLSETSTDGAVVIARSVGELASTAQTMAETVQDANETIANMGDSIDAITVNVKEMTNSSNASQRANDNAVEYMEKLTSASERSANAVSEISQEIAECSEAAEKIKSATVAISEISEQTNLLSLNASIEAARAGESGRGFAVVAGEIQKLAEQSNSSAEEIQNVIMDILSKVEKCVSKAEEMTGIINEQMAFLQETRGKISDMSSAGKELAAGVKSIDGETQRLNKMKATVVSSISDLSAISEETAASSQEVASTVENITNAIESTKDETSAMKELAEALDQKMQFFNI